MCAIKMPLSFSVRAVPKWEMGSRRGENGRGRIQIFPRCPDLSARGDAKGLGKEKLLCSAREGGKRGINKLHLREG